MKDTALKAAGIIFFKVSSRIPGNYLPLGIKNDNGPVGKSSPGAESLGS